MMHRPTRLVLTVIALTVMTFALGVQAQSPRRLNAQGVDAYNAREFTTAIEHFSAALRLEPDNGTIRTNLSNAYQAYASVRAEEGDYPTAISQLEKAVHLNPDNPLPLIHVGAYYLHEGRVRDAVFRLEEAVELAPADVDAHYLLGEAYYRDNDVSSALVQWEWVYEVEPAKPGLAERLEAARREERVEADFNGRHSRHFNVTYSHEAEARVVRDVLTILEKAYRDIGAQLGYTYPPTPIQVSLYSSAGFSESTQMNEHVGAIYDGSKIRCPVVDADGNTIPFDELRRRLYHEYVHVVVRHLAKDGVPWWLNEGLAEALTHDLSARERAFLRTAIRNEALFPLDELTESQLDRLGVDALYVAYKQSHAAVLYLKDRFGARRFKQLLRAIAKGEDPEAALRRVFRHNYHTLELAIADFVRTS